MAQSFVSGLRPRGRAQSARVPESDGATARAGEAVLTMELLDNNATPLLGGRLAPLKGVYFGSNEGRGPVPSVQP